MSAAEADEIYALRLALEPAAAAFAAVHADDADREEAQRVYERLDAAASDNLADVAVRNRDFHTALVRVGGRLLTTQMVQRLSILSERYVVAHLEPSGRDSRAHLEHRQLLRSEEHKSELQSLMRTSYAVFCLKTKKKTNKQHRELQQ